jgi:hypothetical protein
MVRMGHGQGRSVIIDQIKERQMNRLKALQEQGPEGEDMLKKIKYYRKKRLSKPRRRRSLSRCCSAKYSSPMPTRPERKQHKLLEEKAQDEEIMKYLMDKHLREEQQREAERKKQEAKELELAKMRERQQKNKDRQLEIDELRAKRAVENGERAYREKERREATKKQNM